MGLIFIHFYSSNTPIVLIQMLDHVCIVYLLELPKKYQFTFFDNCGAKARNLHAAGSAEAMLAIQFEGERWVFDLLGPTGPRVTGR